jgi:hypothetical protein
MNDERLPRRIIPERGQYVCPGSVYVPTTDTLCICGMPRAAHVWAHRNGAVERVPDVEHRDYLLKGSGVQ